MKRFILVFLILSAMVSISSCTGSRDAYSIDSISDTDILMTTTTEDISNRRETATQSAEVTSTKSNQKSTADTVSQNTVAYNDKEKNNMKISDDGNFSLTLDFQAQTISQSDKISVKATFENLTDKSFTLIYGGSMDGNIIYSGVCGLNDTMTYPSASVEFNINPNEAITKTFEYNAKDKGEYLVYSTVQYDYGDEFNQGIYNLQNLSLSNQILTVN